MTEKPFRVEVELVGIAVANETTEQEILLLEQSLELARADTERSFIESRKKTPIAI